MSAIATRTSARNRSGGVPRTGAVFGTLDAEVDVKPNLSEVADQMDSGSGVDVKPTAAQLAGQLAAPVTHTQAGSQSEPVIPAANRKRGRQVVVKEEAKPNVAAQPPAGRSRRAAKQEVKPTVVKMEAKVKLEAKVKTEAKVKPEAKVKTEAKVKLDEDKVKVDGDEVAAGPSKKKAKREPKDKDFAANGFNRPSPQECHQVWQALVHLHGKPTQPKLDRSGTHLEKGSTRKTVLDSLVGTILSQNTTDTNSHRAFSALKAKFRTWEEVLSADSALVVEAIRSGGLAEIKTARIKSILQTLKDERGEISLEHMHGLGDEEVKAELRKFKGVGPKTIACVLMFTLARAEFPVDAHVWKIALALGWVPSGTDREDTYSHLNKVIPDELKFDLHVLLVEHGKDYKNEIKVLREIIKKLSSDKCISGDDDTKKMKKKYVQSFPELH